MCGIPERQVLKAVVEASRRNAPCIEPDDIARVSGLDRDTVQRALLGLASYGDLFFQSVLEPDRRAVSFVHHVTVHAERVADQGLLLLSAPVPVPWGKRVLGRAAKVVGAVAVAAAAKVIAMLVTDRVNGS